MVHVDTKQPLSLLLPNTNKVLQKVLSTLSEKELATLTKQNDLSTLLERMLNNNQKNTPQSRIVLELLKNNPTLQTLTNLTPTLDDLLKELSLYNDKKTFQQLRSLIQTLQEDISKIDPQQLKKKLLSSGIFLESNLTQRDFTPQNDLKALLLQMQQEIQEGDLPNKALLLKHFEKLLLQIDYFQLYSHLSNGSALFLPYRFDAMESGSFLIKKDKNKNFFCDINLTLKKYGELFVRLGIFADTQININIKTSSNTLQQLLQTNISVLKKQLSHAGLHVGNINFLQEEKRYDNKANHLNLGFEVKG